MRTLVARATAFGSFAALFLLATSLQAQAQAWPQRPVKFIVPFGPGAGVDIGARLVADRLPARWGKPVVVENRPGADGLVARSEEHTSELQSLRHLVCRLLLE